jgi:hypothetical protein
MSQRQSETQFLVRQSVQEGQLMHDFNIRLDVISRCLAIVLGVATCPVSASAQAANADVLQDSQRARIDAAVGTDRGSVVSGTAFVDYSAYALSPSQAARFRQESEEAKEADADKLKYSIAVVGAGDFNSNAQAARTQGTQSVEGDPQVRFGFSKRFSSADENAFNLSGLLVAASDRFVRPVNGDSDSASADIRVQYADKKDDQAFAPFLDYGPSLGFAPTFMAHTGTSQDVSVGFDKTFNFMSNWCLAARQANTSNATTWSVGMTGSVTRRFNDSSASLYLITAQPSLTYSSYNSETGSTADARWNISLDLEVVRRIHDRQGDVSQRDWLFQPILTAVFTPPTNLFGAGLAPNPQFDAYKRWGMPTVQAQIAFLQVDSNVASAQFHQWAIGPTIKLAWSF